MSLAKSISWFFKKDHYAKSTVQVSEVNIKTYCCWLVELVTNGIAQVTRYEKGVAK